MIPAILGGIGLFILGMILLTDGLKAMAGDSLRRLLARATAGPWTALASGAGVTVAVQSSSVTTLATIGFVSAGLLTFPQALGLIVGANLGTTSTGWIIALLGIKLEIGAIFMPLIALGVGMRLLRRGRVASLGMALAGFGAMFVGIDVLQEGMAEAATRIDPSTFPDAGLLGRVMLVGIGLGMAVVMQSSSAAMATTLTALASGTIDLHQAAVLSIGQNIGTTIKSAISAIGGSAAVKRTALSHVLFNTLVGAMTFVLLSPVLDAASAIGGLLESAPGPVTLAAFDTLANVMGAAIFMPLYRAFGALIERLVPERGDALTRRLDPRLAQDSPTAVDAARATVIDIARAAVGAITEFARSAHAGALEASLAQVAPAIDATRRFLSHVRTADDEKKARARHLDVLHALDHLDRLIEAALETRSAAVAATEPDLREIAGAMEDELAAALGWLTDPTKPAPIAELERMSREVAASRRDHRPRILEDTARGRLTPEEADAQLEACRWVDRLGYHAWRTVVHLQEQPPAPQDGQRDAEKAAPAT